MADQLRLNELESALKARGVKLPEPVEESRIYKMYIIDGLGDMDYLCQIIDKSVRTRKLRSALLSRGLRLRADSWLCKNYINNGVGNVDEIVDTMELMQFLFTHTKYEAIARWLLDQQCTEFHDTRMFPDERDCKERAKMYALELFFNDMDTTTVPASVKKWYDTELEKQTAAKRALMDEFRKL